MARTRGSTVASRHWSNAVATRVAIGRRIHTRARARVTSHTWQLARLPSLFLSLSLSFFFFPSSLSLWHARRCRERAEYPFRCLGGLCTGRVYRNVTREDSLSSARFYDDNRTGTASRTRENPLLMPRVGRNSGIELCGLPLDSQLPRVQRTNRRGAIRVRRLIWPYKDLCIAPYQRY